jgi:hypothetical protein
LNANLKADLARSTIRLGDPLPADALRSIERTLQLSHFKWDARVGDASVVFPQPLLMDAEEWAWLCAKAECLAAEMLAFEQEIAAKPAVQRLIGVPGKLRKLLEGHRCQNGLRTLRFDFHPTSTGWLISEVNSDVPGGFGEASYLPALFREFCGRAVAPVTPLSVWADAVRLLPKRKHIALLHAPGYLEDQQVVRVLARELNALGATAYLIQSPEALHWRDGRAFLARDRSIGIDGVVRFFQAEWLARLPARTGWKELFKGGDGTWVSNPLEAVISESKRLPLSFGCLRAASDTWRELSPECRDADEVLMAEREEWVLKSAYSNTGDAVHIGAELPQNVWEGLLRKVRRDPTAWVAQRRFDTITLDSVRGPVRPCVGIFVIGNRAAGAYVRLSTGQVTDGSASEAPLLLMPEERAE